jgi:dihydroorotate dehydrogenase (NAD+) catalytic subunit
MKKNGAGPDRPHTPRVIRAEVTSRRELSAGVVELVLRTDPPVDTVPGQFVEVNCRRAGVLLRRPFSVAGAGPDGSLSLVVRAVGPGTSWLAQRRSGDSLDLLAPCGRARRLDARDRHLLLVGGGIGTPPLYRFAEFYRAEAAAVELLAGAATGEEVRGYLAGSPGGVTRYSASEDGGEGHRGLVTEPLAGILGGRSRGGAPLVVACGPEAMLSAVREVCLAEDVECWVLLEALMACGTGLCRGCAVPAAEGGYLLVCQDGPLFDARELAWPLPATPRPVRFEVESTPPAPEASLKTRLGSLTLDTPILVASGTAGYGPELGRLGGLEGVGAIVTKTVTREPRAGNPPPRVAETPAGMLNSIGLANVGLGRFLSEVLPETLALGLPVMVNVGGSTEEEYVEVAGRLAAVRGIGALELNVSCPNVSRGGLQFGTEPEVLRDLTRRVKVAAGGLPLFVKLSPNVSDVTLTAGAALEGGADGLTLINTLVGMAVDVGRSRPVIGRGTGGLSGPAVRPVAVRMVAQVRAAFPDAPLIGTGGIEDWHDAAEHLIAGANAVSLGTVNFYKPYAARGIALGLRKLLARRGMTTIAELVGSLNV